MKNLVNYSVNRAITVFMVVIIVIVFGVVSYTNLTTDLFPSMNLPYSVVVTTYPGASPSEVEEVVTNPLESALATTTNIKKVTSVSQENVSLIILEFNSDTNMDSSVIEMRETLDMYTANMPDMVGNPMIIKLNPDMMPVMQLSVYKDGLSQQQLTTYVEDEVLPLLERVPGVASVSMSGAYESEVRVIIDDVALASTNEEIEAINDQFKGLWILQGKDVAEAPQLPMMDKGMLSQILMAQNFEFPVGYANVDGVNYLIRVGEEFDTTDEIKDLTVFTFAGMLDPTDITESTYLINPLNFSMDDISDISYVNANEAEYSKVNGEDAIALSIQKSSDFATTDVTNEINKILSDLNKDDSGFEYYMLLDQGEYIEQATGSVSNNLLYGAVLAVLVLFFFLRSVRSTLIVGISIPISLMFAIVLIYFSGITLNIVSLGGLALGIGMLVDNSIVVMENIFRMKKLGHSNKEAAIEGTRQVSGAILASTITTISVFVPVVFIEGFIREIFIQMALTITYSLVASLIIALTLVPAISSRILKESDGKEEREEKGLSKVKRGYEKAFNFAFKFKYIIIVFVITLFGGSIYMALSNGFEYFPASDEGQLSISISNPISAPLTEEEFFDALDDIDADLRGFDDVAFVGITLGNAQGGFMGFSSSNSATASVDLKDDRTLTTLEIESKINALLTKDYTMIEFSISGAQMQTEMLTGSGFQVEISGHDLDVLKIEADHLVELFSNVDGVASVDNGVGIPADEIKITVDKEKAIEYGYMTAIVGGMIAEKLATEDVSTNIDVQGDLYDVYVYDGSSNYSDTTYTIEDIENTVLGTTMMGLPVLVKDVATVEKVQGFSSINHKDGIRVLTVSVAFEDNVNESFVSADLNEILNDFNAPDGYDFEVTGENEEIMEAMNTLGLAVLLAIVLIYMIMASQFQSLTYPLIIMFTIPLAFTGGFLILWITGMPVSVVAMIGFIILVGVVVNNGIVFVDYTNQLRESGMETKAALLEAGKTRLRPIVMTALTTILALITMAVGLGQGAEMMQPMAVTTIGGMLYATVLTLLVVPIMYYLLTEHAKNAVSVILITLIAAGAAVAFYYLSLWYIFLIAAIVVVLLLLNIFLVKSKGVPNE
jgi:HAE1 family hydrophobic/amphiphilic exporter-1